MLERQQTKGLLAVEVIAQQGDAMRRSLRGMFGQPAFASGTFTGLLVMPVLRHAVRWRQGKDLEYREIAGGHHSEYAWAERVGPLLKFLFPRRG